MSKIEIQLKNRVITRDDYSFELMVVGCVLGIVTTLSSLLLGTSHIALGLGFIVIMCILGYVLFTILKKQHKLIYLAALEHELIELTNLKKGGDIK